MVGSHANFNYIWESFHVNITHTHTHTHIYNDGHRRVVKIKKEKNRVDKTTTIG